MGWLTLSGALVEIHAVHASWFRRGSWNVIKIVIQGDDDALRYLCRWYYRDAKKERS